MCTSLIINDPEHLCKCSFATRIASLDITVCLNYKRGYCSLYNWTGNTQIYIESPIINPILQHKHRYPKVHKNHQEQLISMQILAPLLEDSSSVGQRWGILTSCDPMHFLITDQDHFLRNSALNPVLRSG